MKIVKKTKKFIYVELGERDEQEICSSSDLLRVERDLIGNGYTLTNAIKYDNNFEEVDYPSDWIVNGKFELPKDID